MTDGICSKRLAPFLPELLDRLRRRQALREFPVAVQTRVARVNSATVDRALEPLREQTKARRGISTTKAGTLLKRQIPIRTFAEWTEARPGFFEMDLVAHCGWSGAGQCLYTLSMVDVATGWVAWAGLRDKRSETVFHALQRIRAELPFRILGLDSDNGTEFINRALLDYCSEQGITFTRSRPYLKNDTCHVEQKNWAVVRRLVGYDRLEWPALAALERIHDLAGDYVNFLHPVRKLVSKTRTGLRVTRRYEFAQTPFHGLVDSGALDEDHEPTPEALERHRSVPPQGPAGSSPAHACRPRGSVRFLREATMSLRSDPKLRHHVTTAHAI